jgi:hypothetical protein
MKLFWEFGSLIYERTKTLRKEVVQYESSKLRINVDETACW